MAQSLNLQRNSEVFLSTVNLTGGAAVTAMTPSNTWKVEILAGFAMSQSAATQDINSLESGSTPDRSSKRFKTAINPVEWNFQTYLRPTGVENNVAGAAGHVTGNSMPVADWYLWQALASNTIVSTGTEMRSIWGAGGRCNTVGRTAQGNTAAHDPNFGAANEYNLYFKLENVVYQITGASVNQATVDAAIDAVATTTWSGFGSTLVELVGAPRNNAVSVFGGILNTGGSPIAANSNAVNFSRAAAYHPWDQWNVAGTVSTASFIKNRLSSINVKFSNEAGTATTYTFPVTALSFDYTNNITYLTPEELSRVNTPIGNFTGSREITGSFTAYLRGADGDSAQLLRDLVQDRRPAPITVSNANLIIGGTTAPFVAFNMPAVAFDIPTHGIEDIITLAVNFKAQEPITSIGNGGEVEIIVKK